MTNNSDRLKGRFWDPTLDFGDSDRTDKYCYFDANSDDLVWDMIRKERYEVEWCVGLKDKSGKLIYEGDVISEGDRKGFEIKWMKDLSRFGAYKGDDYIGVKIWEEAEIIGNIRQNPELLEES